MIALYIILGIVALIVSLAISYVCGRITAEIIHDKQPSYNEVMWFWLGFVFWCVAILLTLVVKKKD